MFSLAVLVKRSVASIPLSPPQPLYTLTPVFSGENSYMPSANLLPRVAESQQEEHTSLASLGFGNGPSMLAQSCPESYILRNSHSPGPKAPSGSLRLSVEMEQFLLPAASRVCVSSHTGSHTDTWTDTALAIAKETTLTDCQRSCLQTRTDLSCTIRFPCSEASLLPPLAPKGARRCL